jgi:hypothetical protein
MYLIVTKVTCAALDPRVTPTAEGLARGCGQVAQDSVQEATVAQDYV